MNYKRCENCNGNLWVLMKKKDKIDDRFIITYYKCAKCGNVFTVFKKIE